MWSMGLGPQLLRHCPFLISTKQKNSKKLLAVYDHVLKMNSNFVERTLSSLAAKVLCSAGLHQPPDIAGIENEAGLPVEIVV